MSTQTQLDMQFRAVAEVEARAYGYAIDDLTVIRDTLKREVEYIERMIEARRNIIEEIKKGVK